MSATPVASVRGGQVEKFMPADRFTCTVAAGQTVRGGRLVRLTANRTVQEADTVNQPGVIGVALYDRAAGEAVTVATEGVWPLIAAGAITAGDSLVAAAGTLGTTSGRVATLAVAGAAYVQAEANASRAIIGKALETAADAASVPVLLNIA